MIEIFTVHACGDCLAIAANGELGVYDPDGSLAEAHADRMAEVAGNVRTEGPYTEDGAEPFFSKAPCETCGETLAGARYAATVYDY